MAAKWAEDTKRNPTSVKNDIEQLLRDNAEEPFGGLVGPELVNVLQVNVALSNHFASSSRTTTEK